MKEYSGPEVFKVTIASGIANEGLYLGVVTFTNGIAYWIHCVTEQTFQMLLQHVGYLREWFELQASDTTPPVIEKVQGLPRTTELPELSKGFFGRPRFSHLQVKLFDYIKHHFVVLVPVLRSTKEQIFGPLQPVLSLAAQFLALGLAYLINRFVEVLVKWPEICGQKIPLFNYGCMFSCG